jgi:heme/copper-type cytochrome/quinol oxidase subunit 3
MSLADCWLPTAPSVRQRLAAAVARPRHPAHRLHDVLLICSSHDGQGLAAIQHGDQAGLRRFLAPTILGGIIFLSMQAYEWTHLIERGMRLSATPSAPRSSPPRSSARRASTAASVGGVVYLTCVLVQAMRGRYSATNWNSVEIVALYWHFVDLVWILVFTFVYLV